ncbi:hypothetical protein GCM10010399_66740 [Dactylosporangium fulvum]|uniref:Ankyrin repeat domain-containing protein n=1 Tax=Dactylosporangium fulvum TaxID=53359 RepID=A0ABY5VT32_9ACTN|nr:ankyrin repeat domain-containing protein [Dactylosporangium fulvum]UWP80883.1 ankyrin repeat domain-containing protein [Dactylosporangium fulvum]
MTDYRAWVRVRRFAVPPWMIERATECRLAGDWRGACEAANIEVGVDPAAVTRLAGAEVAERVDDDLRHLVPDLLRWHFPRWPEVLALPHTQAPLALYPGGYNLLVERRHPVGEHQRLVLRFTRIDRHELDNGLHLSRERWDSRRTADLRMPVDEELLRLQDAGEWRAAWTHAGFDVSGFDDHTVPSYALTVAGHCLRAGRHDLVRLPGVIRATAARHGTPAVLVPLRWGHAVRVDAETLRAVPEGSWSGRNERLPTVPIARAERSIDIDLVRLGHLPAAALHPLVAAAMFPDAPPVRRPGPARELATIRVRCHGDWHPVVMTDGRTAVPHTTEELRREQALRALGGAPLTGCFAAVTGWTDPRGRTLLHMLSWVPSPVPLLHKLLAAGLDPEARDAEGHTPLLHAVARGGSAELIRALVAAGARRDAALPDGTDAAALARQHRRYDELFCRTGALASRA